MKQTLLITPDKVMFWIENAEFTSVSFFTAYVISLMSVRLLIWLKHLKVNARSPHIFTVCYILTFLPLCKVRDLKVIIQLIESNKKSYLERIEFKVLSLSSTIGLA